MDTAHMRWNLAVAYGLEAAERFLEYYEASHPTRKMTSTTGISSLSSTCSRTSIQVTFRHRGIWLASSATSRPCWSGYRAQIDCASAARGLGPYEGDELVACGGIRLLGEGVAEIKRMYVRPSCADTDMVAGCSPASRTRPVAWL